MSGDDMSYLCGFIGTGNMGGALAKAAAKSTRDILLSDHCAEKAEALAAQLGCDAADNIAVVRGCRYVFLGVKPQMMPEMLRSVSEALCCRDDVILVTMAAGLRIETIRTLAGGPYKVIRIMPNTPVEVGKGEILYTASDNVTGEELERFLSLMRHAGELTPIAESLMDAGCSVSGCGPAFVYKFIRALAQGGADVGLDEDTALALAAQTVIGAARLLTDSPLDPDTLIQKVCSPGGSTIEGVRSLDKDNFEKAVADAVAASYRRNLALGKTEG